MAANGKDVAGSQAGGSATRPASGHMSTLGDFNLQVRKLGSTMQFYWFLSHVSLLTCMVLNTIMSTIRGPQSPSAMRFYHSALVSIIVTYSIVLRQSYKTTPITFLFSQPFSVLRDDNVQYLLLAVVLWLFSSRSRNSPGLYPFGCFALFHSLTYFNANLLAYLPYVSRDRKQAYGSLIVQLVQQYQERSLYVAASMELLLVWSFLVPVIKMVLLLRFLRPAELWNNLQTVFLLVGGVVFNKLRYDQNKYTRDLVTQYDMAATRLVYSSPMVPGSVREFHGALRGAVVGYLGLIGIPKRKSASK